MSQTFLTFIRTIILALFIGFLFSLNLQAREVTFSWEPFENVLGYQIEVSQTMKFDQVDVKKIMKSPNLTTDLPMGTYYYRVRAIDPQKKAGYWSEPMKVIVAPYPPELASPKNIAEYSYFEIPPKIDFTWKPTEGEPVYELFIYKTTGKKMFEQKTSKPNLRVETLTEGEYMWKVRTFYKNIYQSDYCEPRRFTIEKKPISEPKLVDPIKSKMVPDYRQLKFTWEKDAASHFTDIKIEHLDEKGKAKVVATQNNISENTFYEHTFEEDGKYQWSVTTKEGEKTKGLSSVTEKFEIRKDLTAGGDYSIEFGLSLFSGASEFQNNRSVPTGTGTLAKTRTNFHLNGSYFLSDNYGLRLNLMRGNYNEDQLPTYDWQINNAIRMGAPGFSQEFLIGYRQMDLYEFISQPSPIVNSFTTIGVNVGTIIRFTVAHNWRAVLAADYYKPLSFRETWGTLTADVYDLSIGAGWNPFYKFWINYQMRFDKAVFSFLPNGATGSSFTNRTEFSPFFITVSLEH